MKQVERRGAVPAGVLVFTFLLALVGTQVGGVQNPAFGETVPLEQLLNEDGTLNLAAGFSGTLNPKGYRMITAAGGAPRFVLEGSGEAAGAMAASCNPDASWDDRFLVGGVDDSVEAIAVSGTDVYVGGHFVAVNDLVVNHIAKWDGASWSALDSGTNDWVLALAVDGSGNLYAGGYFTTAGGESANRIAKWNGTSWSALGSGMNSYVYALAVSGSDLYAGGRFWTAGGVSANYIAKWDGSSWSALGSGMDSYVFALAVSGSDLYAAG